MNRHHFEYHNISPSAEFGQRGVCILVCHDNGWFSIWYGTVRYGIYSSTVIDCLTHRVIPCIDFSVFACLLACLLALVRTGGNITTTLTIVPLDNASSRERVEKTGRELRALAARCRGAVDRSKAQQLMGSYLKSYR